ncbi:hypothetical protein Q5H92_16005 [Hymenobacter sp. M29]|uniref:Outer membrane protein beta-barrel domain-containing protein n=1 Tax=Hymenobacter mellowenesis TaxID=3063995 RepID=A0ABT9ADG4_9BACT|nr:hypothetical protein [Hymenobacter sp. M29]MDO7847870.1 hypothetical protein [Hymenobacter sp. M29]
MASYSPGGPAIISPAVTAIGGVSKADAPIALYGGFGWEQHDNPLGGRTDYLVVPLYLRFLKPASVFHLSAGAAYAWALNGPSTRQSPYSTYREKVYEREWSVFLEAEFELQRRTRHEYTIALSSRYAFTPTLTTASPRPDPIIVYGRFLALTFNAYFSLGKAQ